MTCFPEQALKNTAERHTAETQHALILLPENSEKWIIYTFPATLDLPCQEI